jgi:hypothetical protein
MRTVTMQLRERDDVQIIRDALDSADLLPVGETWRPPTADEPPCIAFDFASEAEASAARDALAKFLPRS